MTSSSREKLRRFAPLFVLVVAAAVAAVVIRTRPVRVSTAPVDRGPVVREAIGGGTIESEATVNVAFTISGRIAEIRFEEGDRVRAGDVLAVLESDQENHRVAVARRNVMLASHGVKRSAADIRRAEAALEAAEADRRRIESLFGSGAATQASLDQVRERAARADAELAAANAARNQGASSLAVARAGLALDASLSEETIVRSPFDGVVVSRQREPGDVLSPGAVVLTVASTTKVWARTWLDETVLRELQEGQDARVVLRGDSSRSYAARVDRVAVQADRETHEVLVDLELLERPERLVFGQRVDGFVALEEVGQAVRAPRGACDEELQRCYLAKNDLISAVAVRLGTRGTDFVEVRGGLSSGDLLVIPPSDGSPVPVGRRFEGSAR